MTLVKCDYDCCEYCKDTICQAKEINYEFGECQDFVDHTDVSPEYRDVFFKRYKSKKDDHECKKESRGKKYKFLGMTFYTDQDDRNGIDELSFTESVSGYRVQGKCLKEEANRGKIEELVRNVIPVTDLPEALEEDCY